MKEKSKKREIKPGHPQLLHDAFVKGKIAAGCPIYVKSGYDFGFELYSGKLVEITEDATPDGLAHLLRINDVRGLRIINREGVLIKKINVRFQETCSRG
jgi:hypothetical protein